MPNIFKLYQFIAKFLPYVLNPKIDTGPCINLPFDSKHIVSEVSIFSDNWDITRAIIKGDEYPQQLRAKTLLFVPEYPSRWLSGERVGLMTW